MSGRKLTAFVPVTESITITEILAKRPWSRLDSASLMNDYWARMFSRAELVQVDFERGRASKVEMEECFRSHP